MSKKMTTKKYHHQINPVVTIITDKPIDNDHYEIEAKIRELLKQIPKKYDGFELEVSDPDLIGIEISRDTASWREVIDMDAEAGIYRYEEDEGD